MNPLHMLSWLIPDEGSAKQWTGNVWTFQGSSQPPSSSSCSSVLSQAKWVFIPSGQACRLDPRGRKSKPVLKSSDRPGIRGPDRSWKDNRFKRILCRQILLFHRNISFCGNTKLCIFSVILYQIKKCKENHLNWLQYIIFQCVVVKWSASEVVEWEVNRIIAVQSGLQWIAQLYNSGVHIAQCWA